MGQQSRREHVHRVIEHTVPMGACMADVGKAIAAAYREACELRGINPDGLVALPDDWARITADDEHVIIRIEVKEQAK